DGQRRTLAHRKCGLWMEEWKDHAKTGVDMQHRRGTTFSTLTVEDLLCRGTQTQQEAGVQEACSTGRSLRQYLKKMHEVEASASELPLTEEELDLLEGPPVDQEGSLQPQAPPQDHDWLLVSFEQVQKMTAHNRR
ncbi:unnamed protein product, partial [Amoebophrya sp. A25]